MKVLIISSEVWQDTTNGGNVLSSIFEQTQNFEIAQVFCNPGMPQNKCCNNYYQITEKSCLDSFFTRKSSGRVLKIEQGNSLKEQESKEACFKEKFSIIKTDFFRFLRECLFFFANWKSKELNDFLNDFNPDIIFAPIYASWFIGSLDLYILRKTKKPIVGYISDDNYSLKQISFSPFFWISRLLARRKIKSLIKKMSLVYTMTDEQKDELSKFKVPTKILRKPLIQPVKATIKSGIKEDGKIRCIYAGGLYLKRWKIMLQICSAFKKAGLNYEIDIYTSKVSAKKKKKLIKNGCHLKKQVSYKELISFYSKYDMALHIESFSITQALKTRLSFSTKITDCISSGKAILAVGPSNNAGINYLKRENCAIIANSKKDLAKIANTIRDNPKILFEYSELCKKYYRKHKNDESPSETVSNDFTRILKNASRK